MKFLEKNLEDIIYENHRVIYSKGLKLNTLDSSYRRLLRQVDLGNYGIADLINIELVYFDEDARKQSRKNRGLIITVIECKLNAIDLNAYGQVKRYVTGIRQILERRNLKNTDVLIKTILIGSSVCTNGDFTMIYNHDRNCTIYTYEYGLDGIEFTEDEHAWVIGDELNAPYLKPQLKDAVRSIFREAVIWSEGW